MKVFKRNIWPDWTRMERGGPMERTDGIGKKLELVRMLPNDGARFSRLDKVV